MESCKEKQEKLMDFVSNNLPSSEAQLLCAHLKDCQQCAKEKKAIERIWDALSILEEVDVPTTLREETLGCIYAEGDKKDPNGFDGVFGLLRSWRTLSVRRFARSNLGHTLAAIIFGIAMILLYGFILAKRVNLGHLTAWKLLTAIVVWSGLFISAFSFLFSGYSINKINLKFAAAVGIVATGVTMVGAFFCPEATFFQMWMSSKMGDSIAKMTGDAFSHFVFGIVYGFLPALLSATILSFKFKEDLAKNGLIAAFSFVALMLPAAYLQCRYLSLWAIMISFSVGALSGAIGGIFTGFGVTRLKQRWSAA